MRRWFQLGVALLASVVTPDASEAQVVAPHRKPQVLFVCEHGTVRSLLAKVLFEQYAAEVGLPMQAVSRGTRADSILPPWMQQNLAADHFELGSWRPQTLRPDDLANAALVVSFDVPSSATAGAGAPRAFWDSLPSVSRDYVTGRDAIKARVHRLVDSLFKATAARRP